MCFFRCCYFVSMFYCIFHDCIFFFFQAEDGIRDLVRSRGLGDVYKRQAQVGLFSPLANARYVAMGGSYAYVAAGFSGLRVVCLLYTSDAADDLLCVDLGGRRIIKKKNNKATQESHALSTAQST